MWHHFTQCTHRIINGYEYRTCFTITLHVCTECVELGIRDQEISIAMQINLTLAPCITTNIIISHEEIEFCLQFFPLFSSFTVYIPIMGRALRMSLNFQNLESFCLGNISLLTKTNRKSTFSYPVITRKAKARHTEQTRGLLRCCVKSVILSR